jgi:hypothetical protein
MIEVLSGRGRRSHNSSSDGPRRIGKRNDEARDAVIRLTTAVEHIALQLEVMHGDMRTIDRETFKPPG